ncbi:protein translocase subunit SecDF [Pararhizobium antarcticum]|uniref:Multifunctional fusion protein n=1 Tax=Pararhizobium antarcticum TaxID=1798805 RepID=A0A657LK35_9HYPH|nr:protein translocase subunit SecDF [Pararhizobium antarcticum]OJF89940.1 preprotein translocase subunit SecD [Pararhizobium antarcticum]OJF93227.1 preprotein translocase subunit SecD [Rhizobium sp. 58]
MPNLSRSKTILVWLIVLFSLVVALPNVLSERDLAGFPAWMPKKQVSLGLDLQGGSQLLLKTELEDVAGARLSALVADVGNRLKNAGIAYSGLSGTGSIIEVRIRDSAALNAATEALSPLAAALSAENDTVETTLDTSDGPLLRLTLTEAGLAYRLSLSVDASIVVLQRRLEEMGIVRPVVRRQGPDRILVQIPGLQDPQRLKDILSQAGDLSFHTIDMSMSVQDAVNGAPPAASEVVYSADDPPIGYLVLRRPIVSSRDITDAKPALGQSNDPVVDVTLDADGATRLAQVTARNTGMTLAILLDGQVISTPVIRTAITGGAVQVSGNFSAEGANDLAVLLNAGALPVPLTVVEERTIGIGLGSDSISAVVTAGCIAALLVLVFMFAFYGFFGLVANLAVILNVVMIIAVLSATGLTLTLPGIAGIILTIGMAVDSNVLIYERIRDEVRSGRPLSEAIHFGFSRAFAAIVDANITTLIAALILLYLGTGTVRGFAVTLAIGIVTTLFTAFTLTRVMLSEWVRRRKPLHLPDGIRTGMFDRLDLRFMAIRNYVFSGLAVLSVLSTVLFAGIGMNLGIDFAGGSVLELSAREGEADIADITERLNGLNLGAVEVESVGGPQGVFVRVPSRDGGENAEQSSVILIRGELEDAYDFRRVEVVGPSVSGELTRAATIGVLASLLAILVYIWVRFEWQFAIGAIVATLHDVLLTIGLFVVTGMEFNLTSIAALLTVVGYSLNDTVVVYDRIRENLRRYPRMPLPILIDAAINQTLSRTILTAVTTMLALLALCLFGGDMIRSFSIAMLFGVAVGTCSSIYVAGPLLILFKLRPGARDGGQAGPTVAREGA